MTTKKELREALQNMIAAMAPTAHRDYRRQATENARAILARPAVVVGYRVYEPRGRLHSTWRPDGGTHGNMGCTIEWCRDAAERARKSVDGVMLKLVRR